MTTIKAIANSTVFTGSEFLSNHSIVFDKDSILALVPACQTPKNVDVVGAEVSLVCPGYIDLQVNGGADVLFADDTSYGDMSVLLRAHLVAGTTLLFPTLVSGSFAQIVSAIRNVTAYKNSGLDVVGGLHIEGPFINKVKSGVHDHSTIFVPSIEQVVELLAEARNVPVILTVAPETLDKRVLSLLCASEICLMIGHSNATYETAVSALANGFRGITHLFNGMSQLGSRLPGVVGAGLEKLGYSTIIVDGEHVDFASVRIAKSCIEDKLVLISDAMPPVGGMKLKFRIGNTTIESTGDRLVSEHGGLAGSLITMSDAVKNCVEYCNFDVGEAIRMATVYPAKLAGLGKHGWILPGYAPDMTMLDEFLTPVKVVKSGQVVSRPDTTKSG